MKPPKFPQVIAKGNSRGPIYRHTNAKAGASYEEFKLAFYEAGKRKFKTFSTYDDARAAADRITGSVNEGDVQAQGLAQV